MQSNTVNDACLETECDSACVFPAVVGYDIPQCHAQMYLDIKNAVLAKTQPEMDKSIVSWGRA
ncbi:hypothetical protein [Photobacterium damselae]|uniref:hypothetical protein n=1 Tax=Photobacterium damselae TaxID=38293 RepID=UPI0030F49D22